jgi:hypothetical protein
VVTAMACIPITPFGELDHRLRRSAVTVNACELLCRAFHINLRVDSARRYSEAFAREMAGTITRSDLGRKRQTAAG